MEPLIIQALCDYLLEHYDYVGLSQLMLTHKTARNIGKPYMDLLTERLRGWNPHRLLEQACINHSKPLYDLSIKFGAMNHNYGLRGACQGGHRDLLDFLVEKGADDWSYGLMGACHGNNDQLIDYMCEKADDLSKIFKIACQCGHLPLLTKTVHGVDHVVLSNGFSRACRYGQRTIVDHLLRMRTEGSHFEIDSIHLIDACRGGDIGIVEAVMTICEQEIDEIYWDNAFASTCMSGNLKLIEFMISRGHHDWQAGLDGVCYGGRLEVAKWIIQKGLEQGYRFDWNYALSNINTDDVNGNQEIVQFLIDQGATSYGAFCRLNFRNACCKGHLKVIEKYIDQVMDSNKHQILIGLRGCLLYGQRGVARYLIDYVDHHQDRFEPKQIDEMYDLWKQIANPTVHDYICCE